MSRSDGFGIEIKVKFSDELLFEIVVVAFEAHIEFLCCTKEIIAISAQRRSYI